MKLTDVYQGLAPAEDTQAVSQPASAAVNTAQPKTAAPAADNHIALSWLGMLIALILLRLLYEVSE